MADNFVRPGKTVPALAAADMVSGQPIMIGTALFGIVADDVLDTVAFELITEGVFMIVKETALDVAVGDRLFWDSTNAWLDKTTTSQIPVAICLEANVVDTAGTKIMVKLGAYPPAES